jgi:2-isopropylmalate synthase
MGLFNKEYLAPRAPFVYRGHQLAASTDGEDSEKLSLQVERDGRLETWHGQGSGPIDAMVAAIGLPFDVLSYEEHSRGQGSGAMAVSYIEITTRSRRTLFGAGMHSNIITASLLAVISAVNRAIALGRCLAPRAETREPAPEPSAEPLRRLEIRLRAPKRRVAAERHGVGRSRN